MQSADVAAWQVVHKRVSRVAIRRILEGSCNRKCKRGLQGSLEGNLVIVLAACLGHVHFNIKYVWHQSFCT